jgi:hypothetical protein
LPIIEQVVELRVQVFGGRIPRLQEKIIDAGLIDGTDGGVGIGIRGEQRPLRAGKNPHGLLQEFDSIHVRHALVGKQESHAIITDLQLLQQIESALGRVAADDAVFGAVLRTEIALNRSQHIGVVIHTE